MSSKAPVVTGSADSKSSAVPLRDRCRWVRHASQALGDDAEREKVTEALAHIAELSERHPRVDLAVSEAAASKRYLSRTVDAARHWLVLAADRSTAGEAPVMIVERAVESHEQACMDSEWRRL